MKIETVHIDVRTQGDTDIRDITPQVQTQIEKTGLRQGHVILFVPGSTASLTTIEFEDGLLEDLPAAFERIAPRGIRYHHEDRWHDGNGHSHIRASLLGPSLTVPFNEGRLLLGTWQQIVLIDFDNRPRSRRVIVQVAGE